MTSAGPAPVVIALGSNVGDSVRYMREAASRLRTELADVRVSSVYRTAPMYVTNQPDFLNAALAGSTTLGPRSLLALLKDIEAEVGRSLAPRYGPREIDLDLIAYGALSYRFQGGDKALSVPHPRTVERRFVLLPLWEVDPDVKLIGLGRVADLVLRTEHRAGDVEKLQDAAL